ncbi:hypothetical protein BDV10DRAFT_61542 [Aspergillus recurvatus]
MSLGSERGYVLFPLEAYLPFFYAAFPRCPFLLFFCHYFTLTFSVSLPVTCSWIMYVLSQSSTLDGRPAGASVDECTYWPFEGYMLAHCLLFP